MVMGFMQVEQQLLDVRALVIWEVELHVQDPFIFETVMDGIDVRSLGGVRRTRDGEVWDCGHVSV